MKCFCLALIPLLLAGAALAETPVQFAAPNVNAPPDPDVRGLRFSLLHGKNRSVRGVDLGLLSLSETSRASGVAFIGGIHHVKEGMSNGAAFSIVNYHTGRDSGVNGAFVNVLNETPRAFNVGFVTVARGTTMVDLGGVNISRSSTAQIGFINMTDRIESFQFGFINMADNGFLPIFPVFNFPAD